MWCADTERRGRQAQHPELLGWAALTRAVIAYYQGGARLSAATARRGQANAAPGTVAYLKLTAHEMRSLAMLGDAAGMTEANRRAVVAMDRLGPHAHSGGVYSTPRAGDPPYTATSLLLTGQYRNAEQVTRRLVETAYKSGAQPQGTQPTNYARTLLILALAAAGLGELDEADALGAAALESGPAVWPTMVLAVKLDRSLRSRTTGANAGFRDRYIDAPPPEGEPTALVVFGTNQAMPAVIAAARYHRGLAPLIIVTGGVNRHDGVVEGREFARLLAGAEVPANAIRVEDQSADTWQNVELSLPYLREALAMGLHLTAVSKWYHLRAVYCLRTVLPGAVPFYAIGWEPLYAGVPVTRENWPEIPDGRRRVIRESEEVPRRVADGTYQPVTKSGGAWRLSSLSRVPTRAIPRQVLDQAGAFS